MNARSIYEGVVAGLVEYEHDYGSGQASSPSTSGQFGVDPTSLSLLGLHLSTHSGAPAVRAYYQFYDEVVVPSKQNGSLVPNSELAGERLFDPTCPVWVDWGTKQYCSVEQFTAALNKVDYKSVVSDASNKPLPFDHVYMESATLGRAVLYADLSATPFLAFHRALLSLADARKLVYVLRYKPGKDSYSSSSPLVLSGYGVELALKSTEYKVIDDRKVDESATNAPEGSEDEDVENADGSMEETRNPLDVLFEEAEPSVQSLTLEDIKELGIKVSQLILTSEDPLSLLTAISQDLPRLSHLIAKTTFTGRIKAALRRNTITMIQPGTNQLFMNHEEISIDNTLDIFGLLRKLRAESDLVRGISRLSFTVKDALKMLSVPAGSSGANFGWGEAFDIRDEKVVWWNDLEKDKRYKNLPKSISEILRPAYPGQLRYLRKNMFNVLFAIDMTNLNQLSVLTDSLGFIERDIPLRFGVIPVVDDSNDSASSWACRAFYKIMELKGRKEARQFLVKLFAAAKQSQASGASSSASFDMVEGAFKEVTGSLIKDSFGESQDEVLAAVKRFQSRVGVKVSDGAVFLNGKFIDLDENWTQSMLQLYPVMLEFLQQKVYTGLLSDKMNILDYFMAQSNVQKRRNPFIFQSESNPLKFISFFSSKPYDTANLAFVRSADENDKAVMSFIVIGDFTSSDGLSLAKEALLFLKSSKISRLSFIHNPSDGVLAPRKQVLLPEAVQILSKSSPSSAVDLLLEKLYALNDNDFDFGSRTSAIFSVQDDDSGDSSTTVIDMNAKFEDATNFARTTCGAKHGQSMIIVNGRVVGPFPAGYIFDHEDFEVLSNVEHTARVQKLQNVLDDILASATPRTGSWYSETLLKVSSAVSKSQNDKTGTLFGKPNTFGRVNLSTRINWNDNALAFTVGDPDTASVKIMAVLDPASETAQKISPILEALSKVKGVCVQVLLHPAMSLSQLPVKRFYRYVLSAHPTFDEDGSLVPMSASFKSLPKDPLLTLGLDVPGSWLVRPIESIHDLDNIKLSSLQGEAARRGVEALFHLQNLLVQGHAREAHTSMPPRGVQYILGTPAVPHMVDTITMTNLGYFQLKADAGVWELRLREGRSNDVYELLSLSDSMDTLMVDGSVSSDGAAKVIVNSFEGVTVFPYVKKRFGKETEDVLEPENPVVKHGSESGLWDSIKTRVFGSSAGSKGTNTTINVFSVASGHLYERFLGIMMISVMKQTKSPVKFWLIENFLSPKFMQFLPHLAKAYNFDYELVTYKWPHWLRGQTEKQRVIWGYKILFLDVLFPLNLEKVIFVDADQVVRTDLKELVDMDLQGAVYGYTPFCDSRTEMEGFRFWKQGYWKSHLGRRKYHISALYVVDLKQFRQQLAGDRLRQQYQSLSADPNSLSNLDQDLPNNMIHQIPIFSLPQEWLWCETWCSDAELKKAKTIDLCNNPLTKEPKLERAKRILPEWEGLDAEVQAVAKRVATRMEFAKRDDKKHDEL